MLEEMLRILPRPRTAKLKRRHIGRRARRKRWRLTIRYTFTGHGKSFLLHNLHQKIRAKNNNQMTIQSPEIETRVITNE